MPYWMLLARLGLGTQLPKKPGGPVRSQGPKYACNTADPTFEVALLYDSMEIIMAFPPGGPAPPGYHGSDNLYHLWVQATSALGLRRRLQWAGRGKLRWQGKQEQLWMVDCRILLWEALGQVRH